MPGLPLVAALLDLLQNQINASLSRLAYGMAVLMAAAFGLSLVAAVAGLTTEPPPPIETGEARDASAARGRQLRRRLRLRDPLQ